MMLFAIARTVFLCIIQQMSESSVSPEGIDIRFIYAVGFAMDLVLFSFFSLSV